jgi:hypothetical protein
MVGRGRLRAIIVNSWEHLSPYSPLSMISQFAANIARVKATIKRWLKTYVKRTQAQLKEVEEKISHFYKEIKCGSLSNSELD